MTLNRVCFTVCVVSLIVGVICALAMIWVGTSDVAFKTLLSAVVLFVAASCASSVASFVERKTK